MSVKSLSSLFSFSKQSSSLSSYSSPSDILSPRTPKQTFSESMVEENIGNVETIITKWELSSSSNTKVTSLFLHDRKEAKQLLKGVKDLRQAMQFLHSENSTSDKLVHAQNLMQIAMKSLEHQFYQILSKNRDQLDPESVLSALSVSGQSSDRLSSLEDEGVEGSEDEDELKRAGENITEMERVSQFPISDLKAIADCMISCGYGKECTKIYKLIRRSLVDEKLYQLGIERFKASQIHKMNWEELEPMIKKWLSAVKIAVKTIFTGEKFIYDHVFSAPTTAIRESCFGDVTKGGAMNLFRFPELISKSKKSPERIFRLMELYEALSELWPEIESIFNIESTSAIKLQALSSLNKLGDSVRIVLSNFESTIQKDSSKTLAVGCGIHPLTRSVMSYISSLGDYSRILSDIIADYPPPNNSTFPEHYFASPISSDNQTPAVSVHLAWLILVLLCKLDRKAQLYKDVSLSYFFLANNIQFIVERVRTSQLKHLLGDEWVFRQEKKIKQYALNYETMAWTKVFSSLPEKTSSEISPEAAKECFRNFNAAFEEAYMKQTSMVIPDEKLRDAVKISIAKKLLPAYREFYDAYLVMSGGEKNLELLARFGPDDLVNYLSDLFPGTLMLSSSSSSSSLSSSCSSESQGSIRH
ncbi:hypothetical protein EZV62_025536 [Acer yangbiense]|uniref:Exocyst subunit Exo70 family protein n=1 Tax=Acer yangbiense TaxID=1000413 RepID=A0A5C7GYK0_9ROSI|nr:hypothetical protein EZV62_025536 [Acer yangbiense]